jgi:hypothetical protein
MNRVVQSHEQSRAGWWRQCRRSCARRAAGALQWRCLQHAHRGCDFGYNGSSGCCVRDEGDGDERWHGGGLWLLVQREMTRHLSLVMQAAPSLSPICTKFLFGFMCKQCLLSCVCAIDACKLQLTLWHRVFWLPFYALKVFVAMPLRPV